MAVDRSAPDVNWNVREADGSITWDRVAIAVLMDIRRSLAPLRCSNFQAIPWKLDEVARQIRLLRTDLNRRKRCRRPHADGKR